MSARTLYLVIAAVWGATLGVVGGILALGLGYWIVRPISPFSAAPDVVLWLVPAVAVLLGLLIMAICLMAGRHLAALSAPGAGSRRSRRLGYGALAGWAVVTPILIAALYWSAGDTPWQNAGAPGSFADSGQNDSTTAFERLAATYHTIDRVDFFGWNAESGSAGIVMRGNRAGKYAITWQVLESPDGQVLAEGTLSVELGPGRRTVVIFLDRVGLIDAYRNLFPIGKTTDSIEKQFELAVVVQPMLSAVERARLSPQNLEEVDSAQSPLRSGGGVKVPLSFKLSSASAPHTD